MNAFLLALLRSYSLMLLLHSLMTANLPVSDGLCCSQFQVAYAVQAQRVDLGTLTHTGTEEFRFQILGRFFLYGF